MKRLLIGLGAALLASTAHAAVVQLSFNDSSATPRAYNYWQDGSSHYNPLMIIEDESGNALGLSSNNADAVASAATAQLPTDGYNFVYNGTTWDRLRGDTSSGAWVNVKNSTLAVTESGTWTVQPGNTANTTPWLFNLGQVGGTGSFANYGSTPSAVPAVPVNAFVTNTNANGAATPANSSPVVAPIMSHASTTALGTSLVVKASAGNLGSYNCTGIAGAAAGYCIAYNATAAPGAGALTGSLVLDACYFDTTARGCSLTRLPNNIAFSTGIVILLTSATTPLTYTTGTDTGYIEADYF